MSSLKRLAVICGIVFVACNVVAFAIPFEKTAVFWLSDVFVVISLVALVTAYWISDKNAGTARSKFYGFPILRVGFLYVTATLICAIVFTVISFFYPELATWIPLIAYVALTAAAAIGLISTSGAKDYQEQFEARAEADTRFMTQLYADVAALQGQARALDEGLSSELQRLAESIRYSDYVSSSATAAMEEQMGAEATLLRTAVWSSDVAGALQLCRRLEGDLVSRNALCKANKGR